MGITHRLGIDVTKMHASKLITHLKRLKATVSVENGGAYRADPSFSQIHLHTRMDESQPDEWLWATKHGCDYVGVFPLPSAAELEAARDES